MKRLRWLREPSELVVHTQVEDRATDPARVHLWIQDLDDGGLRAGADWLTSGDLERGARCGRLIDEKRYLSRCVALRKVLSGALGEAPDRISFEVGDCGKPFVGPPPPWAPSDQVRFSLSHSDNVLGLTLAFGRETGIDIEMVNGDIDPVALGPLLFKDRELRELQAAPDPARAFYEAWTRNEAVAKLNGHGIASDHMASGAGLLPCAVEMFELELDGKVLVGSVAVSTATLR